jgi:hypothetical protein
METWDKFTSWFFTEILGAWFIWASFMAIKFMSEDAQGQKAAFSLLHDTNVGGFITIPIILSVLFTFINMMFWANRVRRK